MDKHNNENADTIEKIKPSKYMSLSMLKEQLDETNWADWTRRLIPILEVCEVWEYVNGEIPEPNKDARPVSHKNWLSNHKVARLLILQNISKGQLQHINQNQTSNKIWRSITSLYQSTGFRTGLSYMHNLYSMCVADDENIPEYINNMKTITEEINTMQYDDLEIPDKTFARILLQSLLPTWDQFVNRLHHACVASGTPYNIIQLMREIKDEYNHCVGQKQDKTLYGAQQSNMSLTQRKPLAHCITSTQSNGPKNGPYCKCCKKCNHTTDECQHLSNHYALTADALDI